MEEFKREMALRHVSRVSPKAKWHKIDGELMIIGKAHCLNSNTLYTLIKQLNKLDMSLYLFGGRSKDEKSNSIYIKIQNK